jgi:hypothetical protein
MQSPVTRETWATEPEHKISHTQGARARCGANKDASQSFRHEQGVVTLDRGEEAPQRTTHRVVVQG